MYLILPQEVAALRYAGNRKTNLTSRNSALLGKLFSLSSVIRTMLLCLVKVFVKILPFWLDRFHEP
jgi:hypothetical protein